MLEKLSRNARKTMEKQQIEAMQHYLDYLKSDTGVLAGGEDQTTRQQSSSRKWRIAHVMYPPFED